MMQGIFAVNHRLPMVYQAETSECGLACVAMIASYFGKKIDVNSLRKDFLFSSRGVVLKDLLTISSQLDLSSRAVRLELEDLKSLQLPALLHWNMNHYVVLKSVSKKGIVIHDPAVGRRRYGFREADRHITGIAVEFFPVKGFVAEQKTLSSKLHDLYVMYPGFWTSVAQLVGLSLLIQMAAIGSAFYIQMIIDEGLAKRDADFIGIVAIGFAFIALMSTAMTYVRSTIQLYFANQLGFQMVGNVFSHLMRLPTQYFERRHVGDLVSRFGAIRDIRNVVTENLITVVLDGVLALLSLGVMFYFSPLLAMVVFSIVFAVSMLKLALLPRMRELTEQRVVAEAKTSSALMENMRAIEIIKFYCKELARILSWRNTYAEQVNANVALTRFSINAESAFGIVFGLENILVVYLAALLVLDGEISIGLLTAFIAIKGNFVVSIKSFLDKVVQIRLLKLHLERVSDITCTETEFDDFYLPNIRPVMIGALEAKSLGYSYPGTAATVVRDVNLKVAAGEVIVITGPSGSGKSTLIKILAGLLRADAGAVLIDDCDVRDYGVRLYRDECAGVLQTDQLLSGSLIDNICLFDHDVDKEKLQRAAKLACIDDFVGVLPMGYNSPIGDMGSMMSAGQAQRVLLARVFYKQAKIVFLDEATANLDLITERKVLENLCSSGATIVMVSHRPAAIEVADRVFVCSGQSVVEQKATQIRAKKEEKSNYTGKTDKQ
jgi:ATP-binding cassette subfamily B protein RaxB